jgi:hypothetical protein
MPMKLGKKMVDARTVVTIAVYMVFSFFGVLGRGCRECTLCPIRLGLR